MEPISLAWAAQILHARTQGDMERTAIDVCTDTRQNVEGALFFALVGENTDGHRYVRQAFAQGAVGAVVAHAVAGVSGPQLIVPDTLRAYGELALHYRLQFDIPVIGITGSVGKTSTKEMTAALLRTKYRVIASEKNYNNEIGVPRTLFQLTKEHDVALIEMGMRGRGQIGCLADIAQPSIGVITRIGFAHIELLGSQENIARAKAELLERLPTDGVAILPFHDPFLDLMRSHVTPGATVLTFGESRASGSQPDIRLFPATGHPAGNPEAVVMIGQREAYFALKALGTHHLHNAGAALAVASLLGVPLKQATEALEVWEGAPGRTVVHHLPSGLTVLDDCYNASPESMIAALETLAQRTQVHGVAVLGDMKELGAFGPDIHRFVGRSAVDANIRLLVSVGELAEEIAAEAERYSRLTGKRLPEQLHFTDALAAADAINDIVTAKDVVLVKGSRAMEMESIVSALTGEPDREPHG